MADPLFSIITATFNPGDRLDRTIASVAGQPVDLEHLVIDGASTDGTPQRVAALAAVDPRVRLLSEPDRGVYDAMNKGIGLARGRYLYFLGAGDTLWPGVLAHVRDRLPTHDRGFLYGNVLQDGHLVYDGPFTRRKLYERNICHQAIFYGRDVLTLVGPYDLRYRAWSDWATNVRCFGDRRVAKRYLPLLIAQFDLGGVSAVADEPFYRDRNRLFARHGGPGVIVRAKLAFLQSRLLMWANPLLGRGHR